MESRIVYRNSDGVKRTMLVDHANPNQFTVHTQVDMTATLENIKMRRELELAQPNKTNRTLACVPLDVFERSLLEQWDEADWAKWLNDPANRDFRVWPGRV